MATYVIGFPRIGEQRELKKALEAYWSGKISQDELKQTASDLRKRHWTYQKNAGIDMISVNDFSFYDNMLDMTVMLNAVPEKYKDIDNCMDRYFAMARGDANHKAMEMTKWFNTNYHYIVPELDIDMDFKANIDKIVLEYNEAKELGIEPKVNLIGPITYVKLSKIVNGDEKAIIEKLVPVYKEIIAKLKELNPNVTIQMDEPYFVTNPTKEDLELLEKVYNELASDANIYVATYFEHSNEANEVLAKTPIKGMFLDFVHGSENSIKALVDAGKEVGIGIVNGRNVWVNDIEKSAAFVKGLTEAVESDKVHVGSSCSLLHVPYTLKYETKMDEDIKSWISYALEKLDEIRVINKLVKNEELSEYDKEVLEGNKIAIATRKTSSKIHDPIVQDRVSNLTEKDKHRSMPFEERIKLQHENLKYPILPTTTIGSFPQTPELRKLRRDFKNGLISEEDYKAQIKEMIKDLVKFQEEIGLDVLVHGEFERNDMVEYFGEQLNGVAFSQNGWVQSYGSRCVKPPLIYGDVSRPKDMTVEWITYAQSLTEKPMKGMLTGPVTMLNWSFVRDDQPKRTTAYQMAIAIRDEVEALEAAGIKVIQVDEAALREGYPLRNEKRAEYEDWAITSFRITTSSVKPETQIHTHMCYSEFSDIMDAIEDMDADVISIENARSDNSLLKIFKERGYKGEIGPGVYDIHSPRIPSKEEIVEQIEAILEVLPAEKVWINPDCGLKTRKWEEVKPSLKNMVDATIEVRKKLQ
ncbi:5-methyltetrahydropteroyltriglutamate--homocysteine S-methyltransferase [Caminibacter pacificus]|uniref:5-methyltetrahydropteroyltriglutamate--homocysteine methyltransferase n=1 Tax=Caminibacter pacificus TaxID=1424653 RepID=A0AAJ4RCN3_9BACT|nr:5-methyltetrahydropteroyltriglutamate--homocysteine S-methyltransferase [Caminibacter pacificus]NPA88229.1 5-methyltetrahydropteroyltriglutamate--homocysteine S-methyltransferase [Campylobacterota bacterium]QCI27809.1 5-methyltetrahydropteroyltriglutamate--homocysteine S-methyltransferase [Caminibacter pacificus]ROR40016.1 methionine synthase (B12-independent) [Caminibacter pacificus]